MKIDLTVIGQGVVSPAGIGLSALLEGEPVATPVAEVGRPDTTWPVLRVNQKDPALLRWQGEPRLRRASPITLFLMETAEQALTGLSAEDRVETGLIIAFSAGCLVYSRRFFEGIVTQGQRSASPALFPETVFNSPGSHVASVLGLNGAVYALVGDETAWISALNTATVWLRQKRVKQVLVLGAEEFDPIVLDAYRSARWLRRGNPAAAFFASEGAAGLLVCASGDGDCSKNMPTIPRAHDGFIYRSKAEAAAAARRLFCDSDPTLPLYQSAGRNWLASLEKNMIGERRSFSGKAYLGEAFAASAAWNTLLALNCLGPQLPRILQPVWGLNHQLGMLEIAVGK